MRHLHPFMQHLIDSWPSSPLQWKRLLNGIYGYCFLSQLNDMRWKSPLNDAQWNLSLVGRITFQEGAIYCAVEKAGLGLTAWVHGQYIRAPLLGMGALLWWNAQIPALLLLFSSVAKGWQRSTRSGGRGCICSYLHELWCTLASSADSPYFLSFSCRVSSNEKVLLACLWII